MLTRELTETGDRDWLVDCVAQTSIRISHLENMARRVASGLARLGLGPGHILHTAYNSQVLLFPLNHHFDVHYPSLTSSGRCWVRGCAVRR